MLDNVGDGPSDEDFDDALRIAKAALTLLAYATEDESRMLAILGAMTEMVLKHVEDFGERKELTNQFLDTLLEHMAR